MDLINLFNDQYYVTIYVYFQNLYTVWIWLILIKVNYMGRVSEMCQIQFVDIIISIFCCTGYTWSTYACVILVGCQMCGGVA